MPATLERAACQYCGDRPASRPRKLCGICYADRNVRDRFPATGKGGQSVDPTAAELAATEAEQRENLPDWWASETPNNPDRHRGDYWAQRTCLYRDADSSDRWAEWVELGECGWYLTPETEPAAIAADQQAALRGCLAGLGDCVVHAAWLGELACLPVDVVRRRCAEMGVACG